MKRTIGLGGALALGITTVLLATPALAAPGPGVIHVPSDFDPALSDTRATGHYEVVGSGLRIWTDGSGSTDKVAEYVDTDVPLADVGEPTLDYTTTSGTIPPGFQLEVDVDDDGSIDGILVGEPTKYGDDWWLNNAADADMKADAPNTGGGSGSNWYGTLDEWRAAFPDAQVLAFGFSLGSGVQGDYLLNAINFDNTRYTFAADVVLTSKDQCKGGGWATSYPTTYRNQGECVSSFAKAKK
ncbi:hypothetical protein [Blastococcus sp. CT_GayMR16]|uniref:hypothetical protein n=1 Tax=Blastococcus sp. CT_GayMR16 TaxID=2559607 RepID=UPI00107489EA|nr:hypothetical protein [Blastococcus sp. CT_GayMR16]TFV91339.1 hypothetical protein E4P38_01730 [Blastococcus sp. CT_GayMR16]